MQLPIWLKTIFTQALGEGAEQMRTSFAVSFTTVTDNFIRLSVLFIE
jgi:hypothetical protein